MASTPNESVSNSFNDSLNNPDVDPLPNLIATGITQDMIKENREERARIEKKEKEEAAKKNQKKGGKAKKSEIIQKMAKSILNQKEKEGICHLLTMPERSSFFKRSRNSFRPLAVQLPSRSLR